jgi:5-hydroxyisourate hydrolase-like protein (transthyretin family)
VTGLSDHTSSNREVLDNFYGGARITTGDTTTSRGAFMTAVLDHQARVAAVAPIVGTTTVTGTAFDPNGYPLAGIEIRLYDDGPGDGSLVDTATTDDAGRYRFTKVLTDGTDSYRFEAEDMTGSHVSSCSPSFVVKAGVTATHDLTLKVAGIIQGRVATQHVVLVTADGKHAGGEVTVSSNGTFRLGGLPAGTYTVTFQDLAESDRQAQTTVKVAAGRTTTLKARTLSNRRG